MAELSVRLPAPQGGSECSLRTSYPGEYRNLMQRQLSGAAGGHMSGVQRAGLTPLLSLLAHDLGKSLTATLS